MTAANKVSIVLPFRNEARYLTECLRSIQNQSLSQFVLLGIDDGSEDTSADIFRAFSSQDQRFRLVSSSRMGLVAALNLGLSQATSQYIARMDGDDLMHPKRLQKQVDFLDHNPDISVLGCQVELMQPEQGSRGLTDYLHWLNQPYTPSQIAHEIYVESPMAHPSVMFRKQAVEAHGHYLDGDFPEDYELWLRWHTAGLQFARLPECLLKWRDRTDRTSRCDLRYSKPAFERIRSHYLARDQRLHQNRPILIWGAGQQARKRVRLIVDSGIEIKAWIDVDPKKIGRELWQKPIIPPQAIKQYPNCFILNYVNNQGARTEIEQYLAAIALQKGQDYLSVGM